MAEFTKKTLETQVIPVGVRLREARQAKGWTLEIVSAKTKLMKQHLAALEAGNCAGVSTLYRRQFVKKYAQTLGLDPEPLLAETCLAESSPVVTPKSFGRWHLSNLPNLFRWSTTGAIAIICLGYLGLQVRQTVRPPELTLIGPSEGLISNTHEVSINGLTEPEVKIAINGQAVMSDEQGRFNQALMLQPGINTVVVTAEKKHGKTTQATRHIIYREAPQVGRAEAPTSGS